MSKEKKAHGSPTSKKTAAKKSATAKKASAKKLEAGTPKVLVPVQDSPAIPTPISSAILYEEIRIRAYELYVARGCKHGAHESDWYLAEAEVRTKHQM